MVNHSKKILAAFIFCISTTGLFAQSIGNFPDTKSYIFARGGEASHNSALIYNSLYLQNSRSFNDALIGISGLNIPVTEPKTDTKFLNIWEAGYSFGSDSGIHRGILTLRYMGAHTEPQNTANFSHSRTSTSTTAVDSINYQYDIYDQNDLRRYALNYVSEFNLLTGAGSKFVEGFGLRLGINAERETYESSGYRSVSNVTYTTVSNTVTPSLQSVAITGTNDIDSRVNSYALISGLVYKFPITNRVHVDLGADYYVGYGSGEAIYKSVTLPDASTIGSIILLTGTDPGNAQSISDSLKSMIQPRERKVDYDTGIIGNVYTLGVTFHISPFFSMRTYYRDERLTHRIRSSETQGISEDVTNLVYATAAAQQAGSNVDLSQANLQLLMTNVDDLGPLPKYTDRMKEGGIEFQIRF